MILLLDTIEMGFGVEGQDPGKKRIKRVITPYKCKRELVVIQLQYESQGLLFVNIQHKIHHKRLDRLRILVLFIQMIKADLE